MCSGGTFSERKVETINPPKSQKHNCFMVTRASPIERAVYCRYLAYMFDVQVQIVASWKYICNLNAQTHPLFTNSNCRSISCTCNVCFLGKLGNCRNSPFVPDWEHSVLDFRPCTPLIGIAENETEMWNKLQLLHQEKDTLPFFCCLAWVGGVQHPTVLYIKHLRLNPRTVRCHVLRPHKPVINDFGWTLVLRPNQLCNKLAADCNCNLQHAVNFEIKHKLQ